MKPPEILLAQLPNLDILLTYLDSDPQAALEHALTSLNVPSRGGVVRTPIPPQLESIAAPPTGTDQVLQAGTRALNKIASQGEAVDLEPDEAIGLEAIVQLYGRPALLVENHVFEPAPPGWEILEEKRAAIETNMLSVGRIEVAGHPRLSWIGTGFLVAEQVIMTNRHVALEFCEQTPRKHWRIRPDMLVDIDFNEEKGAGNGTDNALEYNLTGVVGIHEEYDLALLRVAAHSRSGQDLPPVLGLSAEPPSSGAGHKIYVVGYPALDSRNNLGVMQRIFNNIYNVKRLQPGEITTILDTKNWFLHDCSTLGGNSGSCVIDLETNLVIGLHFGGAYLKENTAISLWRLQDDPLIQKANIRYT